MVKRMMDADFKSKDSGSGKWWLGGLLGSSILVCSLLYVSNKTKPETAPTATAVTDIQKTVSEATLSKPGQKHTGQVPLHQLSPQHLLTADAIPVKTASPQLNPQEGMSAGMSTDLQNQKPDMYKAIADTAHIKNALSETNNVIQKTDVCMGVSIDGILSVDAACTNKNDGEIHIREESLKGGHAPYTYILVHASTDTIRQKTASFVSLPAGSYKLFFKDANACVSAYRKPLYVNEKPCATRAQSFSPHVGEQFNYPVSGDSDAEITIYNRGGQLVHKTHVAKGASEFWDGTNQNGQLLPTGMYIYIIEYLSGIKETGEVVIF
jgi:hypothetical protein